MLADLFLEAFQGDLGVFEVVVQSVLLGAGRPAAADLDITTITEARRFDLVDATTLPSNEPPATDLRLRLRPTKEI